MSNGRRSSLTKNPELPVLVKDIEDVEKRLIAEEDALFKSPEAMAAKLDELERKRQAGERDTLDYPNILADRRTYRRQRNNCLAEIEDLQRQAEEWRQELGRVRDELAKANRRADKAEAQLEKALIALGRHALASEA